MKMCTKKWGKAITATQNRVAYPTQMPNWQAKAFLTRSGRPAPKLYPMRGWPPWQMPWLGMEMSWLTLVMMVMAPTATSPP